MHVVNNKAEEKKSKSKIRFHHVAVHRCWSQLREAIVMAYGSAWQAENERWLPT